jgi:hypothetical protein
MCKRLRKLQYTLLLKKRPFMEKIFFPGFVLVLVLCARAAALSRFLSQGIDFSQENGCQNFPFLVEKLHRQAAACFNV